MLFARATADGIRVSGFIDHPSLVFVACKSAHGERRVVPLDFNECGFVTVDSPMKGFTPIGIPAVLKTARTLYVSRLVKNAEEVHSWFAAQGMKSLLAPQDMHVTVAFSKRRVDWEAFGEDVPDDVELEPSLRRAVMPLGDEGAVVLRVASPLLHARWKSFVSKGASWDHDGYRPHITLSYAPGADAGRFVPFPGRIILGPERFSEVNENWVAEHAKSERKSPPKGYPEDRSEYAVPESYEFPIDEKHIHAAIGYFHTHKFKDAEQKKRAAKRIMSAARRHGVEVGEHDDVARAARGE